MLYLKTKQKKVTFLLVTFIVITAFLCPNLTWAGIDQSYLAPKSVLTPDFSAEFEHLYQAASPQSDGDKGNGETALATRDGGERSASKWFASEFEALTFLERPSDLLIENERRIGQFVDLLPLPPFQKWYVYITLSNFMDRVLNQMPNHYLKKYVGKIEVFYSGGTPLEKLDFLITIGEVNYNKRQNAWAGTVGYNVYELCRLLDYDNEDRLKISVGMMEAAGMGISGILELIPDLTQADISDAPTKGSSAITQIAIVIRNKVQSKRPKLVGMLLQTDFHATTVDPIYGNRLGVMNPEGGIAFQLRVHDFELTGDEHDLLELVRAIDNDEVLDCIRNIFFRSMYLPKSAKNTEKIRNQLSKLSIGKLFMHLHETVTDILIAREHNTSVDREYAQKLRLYAFKKMGAFLCMGEDLLEWVEKHRRTAKKMEETHRRMHSHQVIMPLADAVENLKRYLADRYNIQDILRLGREHLDATEVELDEEATFRRDWRKRVSNTSSPRTNASSTRPDAAGGKDHLGYLMREDSV